MTSGKYEICNRLGLHARAAARLVQLAETFTSSIWLSKDGNRVNGKSIMGVLLLCGYPGAILTVEADGPDEVDAVDALGGLIQNRFGEEA